MAPSAAAIFQTVIISVRKVTVARIITEDLVRFSHQKKCIGKVAKGIRHCPQPARRCDGNGEGVGISGNGGVQDLAIVGDAIVGGAFARGVRPPSGVAGQLPEGLFHHRGLSHGDLNGFGLVGGHSGLKTGPGIQGQRRHCDQNHKDQDGQQDKAALFRRFILHRPPSHDHNLLALARVFRLTMLFPYCRVNWISTRFAARGLHRKEMTCSQSTL